MTLTPYVNLLGTYDLSNSLPNASTTNQLQQYSATGIAVSGGLDGYHFWQKSALGVTLRANYRHYMKAPIPDANDEFLSFGFQHQVSRRVTFSLTETAGASTRAVSGASFGLGNLAVMPGLGSLDQNLGSLPTNEIFDGRVYFSSTSSQVSFQRTARQAFFGGGGAFFVRRSQSGTPGSNGVSGYIGTEYMISRRQSLSLQYSLLRYDYTGSFGSATANMGGVAYGVMLNRFWNFRVQGGAYRVYLKQPIRVTLDPNVAALLGQSSSVQTFNGATMRGMGNVSLNGTFHRSTLAFVYARTMSAGNSVFLTSQMDTGMASYSYQLRNRATLSVGAYVGRQSALSANYKPLKQVGTNGTFSYRLASPIYFTASIAARHTFINSFNYRPTSMIAVMGVGITPSHGLPIW